MKVRGYRSCPRRRPEPGGDAGRHLQRKAAETHELREILMWFAFLLEHTHVPAHSMRLPS